MSAEWTRDLDEAGVVRLAELLALKIRVGDVIALRGDLGACQRRLAGPDLSGKGHDIALAQLEGQQLREPDDAGFIEVARKHRAHALAASGAGSGRLMPSSGKRTVTHVPRPGSDSSDMVPPCSSTRLLTIDRPSPAPRCLEPWLRLSKRSSTRCC